MRGKIFFRQTFLSRVITPIQRHRNVYLCYNGVKSVSIHSKSEDSMMGDYPSNVPFINRQTRNPYDPEYFDVTERRKFGETLHEQDEILSMFSMDIHPHITTMKAILHLFTFGLVVGTICSIAYVFRPKPHGIPREDILKKLERP
ncbi:hypothetical protein T552_03282 [Pneumocystis carinii B80]|uniref:Uncharacterized protein n=1 Tax=Pneumocystis carinii (strain B80) TaxID=1408658 RepID=A0A0W4ZCA2_PNEC8|nr:hypothetical protein T552_03282 [Pneumocystis carinii B80]KTW26012.1 hypothetical protein T552_03282 [Pneumocystis carinii B80]